MEKTCAASLRRSECQRSPIAALQRGFFDTLRVCTTKVHTPLLAIIVRKLPYTTRFMDSYLN